MARQARQPIDELEAQLVMRAQTGDRTAFAELYRRHAHPAWRLALAVGGSTAVAEQAVAQGFTAALRRLRRGTTTLALPFRLQVVRASAEAAAAAARREGATVDMPPNEVVTAFRRLPERWRAGLWLTAVEGGTPAQVAPVLALTPDATVSLIHRAAAGLRERSTRVGGPELDDIRDAVPPLRTLVVPVPDSLEERTFAHWQAWQAEMTRNERRGLAAVVPLGAWGERAVAGAAAGIFAAGIACAVALTSGPSSGAPQLASPASSGQVLRSQGGTDNRTAVNAPTTVPSTGSMFTPDLSLGGGRAAAASSASGGAGAVAPGAAPSTFESASSSGAVPTSPGSSSSPSTSPSGGSPAPTPSPAPAPAPQPPATPQSPSSPSVSGGGTVAGTPVSGGAGSGGTGASAGGTTVGSPPPPPDSGTTVTIETGVLPPITVGLP
jgi:DNA-directed RNA polymerase specialized sigma24 family protein